MEKALDNLEFCFCQKCNIFCVCTKLYNYAICKSMEAGVDYGTVGVFYGDVVDPQNYGIEPLQGGAPNGNSDFVSLPTQSNVDKQALFSTTDIDSSCHDSIVADLESFSIRRPVYNAERNEYN